MKAQPSPLKKSSRTTVALRLSITHNARSLRDLSEPKLRAIARRALLIEAESRRYAVALAFVSDVTMQRLNREFAGNDYTTDVLSFLAREDTGAFYSPLRPVAFLGDIAISVPQAARQAREAGHSLQREVELLLAHGMLHLLGHDHATRRDRERMDELQHQILSPA